MTRYVKLTPACWNYGKAVNDFIAACVNRDAMQPVAHWRWLHRCVARLQAAAVDYSLVEGMKLDWPACLRHRRNLGDELQKYQLNIEAAIQCLSSVEHRTRVQGDLPLPETMPIYSETLTVLLNELRCSLLGIHGALLVGYSWWLEGHADDQMRACECWREAFERGWGAQALSFLRVAAMLSSAQGEAWRYDGIN